jgi:pyruvate, water dikinase
LIASAFYPKEVIVRFSDFKTNEYRNLIGGELFEKQEANPMIGYRGACRYLDQKFQPAFKMECQAIERAREVFGLKNISVMVPFCRTLEEGRQVVKLIKKFNLGDVKTYVMCEIPSNVILADEFLEIFDGMSIGSNDLTQLMLGLDRDNAGLSHIGDESNQAVLKMISQVISSCRKKKKYCGICGDAPSSLPEFTKFLLEKKIPSISLTPDAVIKTIMMIKKNV